MTNIRRTDSGQYILDDEILLEQKELEETQYEDLDEVLFSDSEPITEGSIEIDLDDLR